MRKPKDSAFDAKRNTRNGSGFKLGKNGGDVGNSTFYSARGNKQIGTPMNTTPRKPYDEIMQKTQNNFGSLIIKSTSLERSPGINDKLPTMFTRTQSVIEKPTTGQAFKHAKNLPPIKE